MAVTFHNFTQTAGPASVGTKTVLHTISAAETVLLVFSQANTAISLSAVGANGIPLTRLGHMSASSSRIEVWGLSSGVPNAVLSISANVVGAASLDFCLAVVSYTGARMIGGSPFGTVVAGSAQATANPSFSVSSTSTDLVAYGFGVSGAPAVTITTGTNRGSSTATTAARLVIGDVVGAATVSISATAATSNTWGFLAVPIVASAAAVTNIQFDNAAYTATAVSVNSRGMVLTATSNACLMVWTEVDGGNQTLTSVVVNSNLTAGFVTAVEYKAASIRRVELWVLTAPPSGNLTISANIKGVATASIGIGAATYTGHRTNATPFGNTTVASASATAQFAIVGSSTIGNVLVFGMGHDNNQAESPGPGLTLRVNSGGNYPNIGIYDTPGQLAATASMTSVATAYWGAIAIELIQSTVVSGNAASITDVRDTFSASGQVIVQGSLAATDTRDKFSVSGQVIVQGRMSATDVIGTFSATGYVVVSARLSATDARDKFSASGYGIVTARLSATDARDVFSASGYGIVTARLSATDVQDKFSASGQTIVAGRVSATDVVDRFSASGQLVISARLSATDVTDKFSASGVLVAVGNVNGSLAATDARDTASISGYVVVSGSINFTDHADTFAAQGITTVATPVITAQDAGSGGGHGKQQPEYFRADPAFWSLREQYLKRIHKDISAEPAEVFLVEVPVTASIAAAPIDQGPLAALRASRARTIEAIPVAANMRQLRYHGARLIAINSRIAEQKRLLAIAEQQARLAAQAARKIKRARTIRKAKRKIVMLAATRAVAALSYIYSNL